MLEFKNGKYFWDGVGHDSFKDALRCMCNEITNEGITPKFGDLSGCRLGHKELQQYVLLYAIYNMDVSALMQCANAEQYRRATGKTDSRVLPLLKQSNPIYMKTMTLPMGYASNKAMQCVLLPQLSRTYQLESRSIPLKRGKFPYETVLSYLCDTVLFNPHNSPFTEGLRVFTVLGKDSRTNDLDNHVSREDYGKLKVLCAQLQAGDVTTPLDEFITIGDVRKGRYSYASKDWLPEENCIEMLLECPPALQSDNYLTWWSSAAAARGHSQEVIKSVCSIHESFVDDTPVLTHPSDRSPMAPNDEKLPPIETKVMASVDDIPVTVHPVDRTPSVKEEEEDLPPIESKTIYSVKDPQSPPEDKLLEALRFVDISALSFTATPQPKAVAETLEDILPMSEGIHFTPDKLTTNDSGPKVVTVSNERLMDELKAADVIPDKPAIAGKPDSSAPKVVTVSKEKLMDELKAADATEDNKYIQRYAGAVMPKTGAFGECLLKEDVPAPTESDRQMALVAQVYCSINDVPYGHALAGLKALGVTEWEDINRALPVFLRRNGHSVDVSVLTEYSRSLDKYYGGFELKSDF